MVGISSQVVVSCYKRGELTCSQLRGSPLLLAVIAS